MENLQKTELNISTNIDLANEETKINLIKDKLDNLKKKVKKILFVQPLQIEEDKIDVKIALNKRYYMYPPYGIGILNKVFKNNNYDSDILDLNFEIFNFIHDKKEVLAEDLTKAWKKNYQMF